MNSEKTNDRPTEHMGLEEQHNLDMLCVNTIRFLSVDAVQKANSGHPGLPMGAAPMAYVLWTRFLKHNPRNPNWFDRDRFILSAGHGSMLLYSLLHLTGYELPLEQIKQFRQWGSMTPGHPERGITPGVETTTGPLGQGFGNGVGMAMAEAFLAARYNRPGHQIIDHYTYSLVSDGDLMEGVASEAASLAGHLRLGKLIYLFDNNHVTLSAATNITFTEDIQKRFTAYGWQTLSVEDGNDLNAIQNALKAAREDHDQPSLILVRTHLGYGSPNKQDTYEAHGSPLGEEEVRLTKKNLNWPVEPPFLIPEEALTHFREAIERGRQEETEWDRCFTDYEEAYPELAEKLHRMMLGELPDGWNEDLPQFPVEEKEMATRVASGKVMNALAAKLPNFLGGSADLDPSTHTALKDKGDFESPLEPIEDPQGSAGDGWKYSGSNLHFGVREHGMGAILNGLATHGGLIPFGATFLIFSDYMRPPIRLAALMGVHVIYVFTHDSIGLGEDGPTHQPVEQLLGLRSIPNMLVFRPADANETSAAWRVAIEHQAGPAALVLTRQSVPILDLQEYPQIPLGVRAGGYVLAHSDNGSSPDITLIASGSEVHLALEARKGLEAQNLHARIVSLPCWNLFELQSEEYRQEVLLPDVPMLSVEAGTTLGWRPYAGPAIATMGVDRFGASAPGKVIMKEYSFTVDKVIQKAIEVINRGRKK
jgi:transketolase